MKKHTEQQSCVSDHTYSLQRVNDYNVLDLEYTVSGLSENQDYEFRVSAVNSAGKGDPSQVITI